MRYGNKRIAIERSIEHWYENLSMLQLNYLFGYPLYYDIYIDGRSCALCVRYYKNKGTKLHRVIGCSRCPISERGHIRCMGTPLKGVRDALRWSTRGSKRVKFYGKLYEAIVSEINFLYEIREG